MKTRKIIGWFVVGLGGLLLMLSLMSEYNINLGPLNYLYELMGYFSIGNIVKITIDIFLFFLKITFFYFWYLCLIIFGFIIIFRGDKNKADFDEDNNNIGSRRLALSTRNKMVSGVCGGISHFLNLDTGLVRFIFIILLICFGGMPVFLYLLLAIMLPETSNY